MTDEVVEVFTGDTLEEAMAYAVASLGPDLAVRRARKVRKGVQGLVGRDRYEVVAVPPPTPAPDDAVGSAFDALLSQAEEAETPLPRVRRTTRVSQVPHPSPAVADHTQPSIEPPAPHELVPDPPAAKPRARKPPPVKRKVAPQKAPLKHPLTIPSMPSAVPGGWSREALAVLGLPAAVLDALPVEEPADDLAWVVALAAAMTTVLPAPATPDDAHPLVVNGYGTAGVLGLLDAAARGLTPGTITIGDRTAAATATELALAVRTAVVG